MGRVCTKFYKLTKVSLNDIRHCRHSAFSDCLYCSLCWRDTFLAQCLTASDDSKQPQNKKRSKSLFVSSTSSGRLMMEKWISSTL